MNLLDVIDIEKVRRAMLYFAALLITLVTQNMLVSQISFFGARALFLPALVVAVGLFEGGIWGGVFGLIAGLLGDSAFTDSVVTFTIAFPVLGFFSGMLAEFVINRRFFSYMLLSLGALLATALCQAFPLFAFSSARLGPLLRTVALQGVWSLPFAAPIYLVCKKIAERFEE